MERFQNYVANVASTISGQEGYSSSHNIPFATMLVLCFYIILMIGAGSLSYNYNGSIGTSGILTIVYVILCTLFPSFYYPYYALVLSPVVAKSAQKGGGRH